MEEKVINIDKIDIKDLTQVMLIEHASFSTPWKQSFFEAELSLSNSNCLKASIDKKIVGYIIARDFVSELHILNIAVHPEHKRQGIASKLLSYIIDSTDNKKIIVLEVRLSNTTAQKLYKKHGFFVLQRRKSYYPDGEDAMVMIKGDIDEIWNK